MSHRYHGVAIGLHWLSAILIVSMLVGGNYITSLGDDDPVRYVLVQWHKSFGIIVLFLVLVRLFWRVTHRAPPLPSSMKVWEQRTASVTHLGLYVLILVIPMSGWIMVSASPMNLPTIIFDSIEWPHLPLFSTLTNKAAVSAVFVEVHEIAGSILTLLLLAHVGAALRHHFVLHDAIMSRMSPLTSDGTVVQGLSAFSGIVLVVVAGFVVYALSTGKAQPLAASSSDVSFTFVVLGSEVKGDFSESDVSLAFDPSNPSKGSLSASIRTASATTGNSQVDATLPQEDWFNTQTIPQATFLSSRFEVTDDGTVIVSGMVNIKGAPHEVTFPLAIVDKDGVRVVSGEFTVNRLTFGIGSSSQPNDDTVAFDVVVRFEFSVE